MVGPNSVARQPADDSNLRRNQAMIDRDSQRNHIRRPGWMDSPAPGAIDQSGFFDQTLEVVGPGCGVQIAEHNDWTRLACDKCGQPIELLVSKSEVLRAPGRQCVRPE